MKLELHMCAFGVPVSSTIKTFFHHIHLSRKYITNKVRLPDIKDCFLFHLLTEFYMS